MSDSGFCPKCKTGVIVKFNRDEEQCSKCGKMYGASAQAPSPVAKPGPRPGGNRCAG